MPLRRLSENELNNIVRLGGEGYSQRLMASIFNVAPSVINRALERFRTSGNVNMRHGGGRRRSTTVREDRAIVLAARRNRTSTANGIKNQIGLQVSASTIRRRLHEVGLRSRKPARYPRLERRHRVARRLWAEAHMNWTLEQWRDCVFTDESKFSLFHSDGRLRVWREAGERYNSENMVPTEAFGGGSVTVWGGINFDGRTELVVLIRATITGERYRDMVILPIIVPLARQIGPNFILVDDNARPHRARCVNLALQENNITRMEWPAKSPDMNPIEHVWDKLGRQLLKLQDQIASVEGLARVLIREWNNIDQDFLQSLIMSMPRRCTALHLSRGGPTRY